MRFFKSCWYLLWSRCSSFKMEWRVISYILPMYELVFFMFSMRRRLSLVERSILSAIVSFASLSWKSFCILSFSLLMYSSLSTVNC